MTLDPSMIPEERKSRRSRRTSRRASSQGSMEKPGSRSSHSSADVPKHSPQL